MEYKGRIRVCPEQKIGIEESNLPRYIRFRGRKVRLIDYRPKTEKIGARFVIIDTDDTRRSVARCFITFIK